MKRSWAAFLVTSLIWAGPGHAQFGLENAFPTPAAPSSQPRQKNNTPAPPPPTPNGTTPQQNQGLPKLLSQFCTFTFFSNGTDRLGAPSENMGNCVDTGEGDDRVVFPSDEFLNGAYVYSDTGRSVLRFSDGPYFFFDQRSTAQKVTSGNGNDILRFGMDWAQTTQRAEVLPETVVEPGGGNDLLFVGGGEMELKHPRQVPNLFVFPVGESLSTKMSCGRPFDKYALDVLFENTSEITNLNVVSKGCGVSLRNHAAPTVLEQSGGRTVVEMRPTVRGYAAPFEMNATNASAFSGFFVEPGEGVDVKWSGYGLAAMRLENFTTEDAGSYDFQSDDTIFAQFNLGGASLAYKARTSGHLEIEIFGPDSSNLSLDLGAHSAHVTWQPESLEMFDITWAGAFEQNARWDSLEMEEFSSRLVAVSSQEESIEIPEGEEVPEDGAEAVETEGDETPDETAEEKVAPAGVVEEEGLESEPVEDLSARDNLGRTGLANQAIVNGLPLNATIDPGEVSHWNADERLVKTELQDVVLEFRVTTNLCDAVIVLTSDGETRSSCDEFLEWSGALDGLRFEKGNKSMSVDMKDWPVSRLTIVPVI